jgi:succinate dehydrogenase/fumarate reductase flavoprotein subunit
VPDVPAKGKAAESKVDESDLQVDLLVIGAGMAGMTAAAMASEAGLTVLVVEKQARPGGSAILSGGGLWTARDLETLRRVNPLGDPDRAAALISGYDAVGDFIASLGTAITDKMVYEGMQSFPGWSRQLDVADWMKCCQSSVQAAGGWIVTESTVSRLLVDDGQVCGGNVTSPDGDVIVRARHVLIATGGFQNSPAMRNEFLPGVGAQLIPRSNPASDGHGIRLGREAGAALSEHMSGWYGHTIPYPVPTPLDPQDYIPLAQFYLSPRALLLDAAGRRFTDESLGYYLNAQAVAQLPSGRALVVFDDGLREEDSEKYGVDRWDYARRKGANVARGESVAALTDAVAPWGYAGVADAVTAFNAALAADGPLDPPRVANRCAINRGPFFAIEVQPAITFTHGGLSTDAASRVLDDAGQTIPGLLAAGADAGGTYHRAYAGGLAMAAVFGMIAAQTALAERNAAAA